MGTSSTIGRARSPRCEPEYYRWNQWLFLRLYEHGLAYKREAPVNWCPHDQDRARQRAGDDGRCWRCSHLVERRNLSQWFLRITDYADRLLDDLEKLDGWPERTRDDAAALDWAQRGSAACVRRRRRRRRHRSLHDARRYALRRDVSGDRAGASASSPLSSARPIRSAPRIDGLRAQPRVEVGYRALEPHGEARRLYRRVRDQPALARARSRSG